MLRDKLAMLGLLAATGPIVLSACGSSSKAPDTAGDGGGGGDQDGGGGGGGGGGGSVADVCSKTAAYYMQCGGENACAMAELAECTQLFSVFSSAYIAAIDACVNPPYQCTDGGMSTVDNSCIQTKISTLAPTAAQSKVRTDFCAVCPDGQSKDDPQSCSDFFATTDAGSSIGTAILELNDATAQQIDQSCLSAARDAGITDCYDAFEICTATILETVLTLPAACMTDAG